MAYVDYSQSLADQVRATVRGDLPDDAKLVEIAHLIEADILKRGRVIQGEPSMAAVLEERIKLPDLTTKQKLQQSLEVIEFMEFFVNMLKGIFSSMPNIVKKVAAMTPGFDEFIDPHRKNLN